jgi:hypothetical protein
MVGVFGYFFDKNRNLFLFMLLFYIYATHISETLSSVLKPIPSYIRSMPLSDTLRIYALFSRYRWHKKGCAFGAA